MSHHRNECEDAAIDAAWEIVQEEGLVRHIPATRDEPECWDGDVDAESFPHADGWRVVCTVNGTLVFEATYQVEGGFGDDGRSGRAVLQNEINRYPGRD